MAVPTEGLDTMATGKVKWFNNAKGYGFVRPDSGGDDLFVHYSYICMDGYKSLKAGQLISYEVREAPKGLHAMNIAVISDVSDAESAAYTNSLNEEASPSSLAKPAQKARTEEIH
jgi:CspA family cold shock protein